VLAKPARTAKAKMSRARSKARAPFAKRSTRYPAESASRVFPTAIPSEVATDPAVVTLTRKAPARTAGHTRAPKSSAAAIAIPVGGQTGLALAWTMPKRRPNFPATK
jgi:hypothetical protein